MSAIRLRGATSGTTDVVAAAIAGDGVLTLPSGTGTLATAAYVDAAVAAGGKVLQVVRATDTTSRTTTSASFVDVTGMSVTITPQKTDSAIIVFCSFAVSIAGTASSDQRARYQITNNSNVALSGSESQTVGTLRYSYGSPPSFQIPAFILGYDTPATLSATTYKLRFLSVNASITAKCSNDTNTGQIFAWEIAA